MSYEEKLSTITIPAGSDLSSYQFYMMTINSSKQLARAGAGVAIDGVLQDGPSVSGYAGCLAIAGVTKVVVGGVVTKGDNVTPDSSGRAVTAASGDVVSGKALETSTAAGQIIAMLLNPQAEPLS